MRALLTVLLTLAALAVTVAPYVRRRASFPVTLGWRLRLRMVLATGDLGGLFFRRGKGTWWWVTTLSSTTAPSAAQINAGNNMDKAIADLSGFEAALNRISQPWWDSNTDIQVDGPEQLGDAQMVLLDDDGTAGGADDTARAATKTAMVKGATGYLVHTPLKKGNSAAGDKAYVWPAKIGAVNLNLVMEVASARYTAQFAVTGTPTQNVTVAA